MGKRNALYQTQEALRLVRKTIFRSYKTTNNYAVYVCSL